MRQPCACTLRVLAGLTLTLCGTSLGCAGNKIASRTGSNAQKPVSAEAFDSRDLRQVEIALSETDWEKLRWQGRSLSRVYAGCFDFEGFDYFDATVTIDGETVDHVAVRKKGFLGSLSTTRPSLKVDFGRGQYGQRSFHGQRRWTLNNNKQDLSNVRQCLSYELFARAKIKAPLCGFARVTAQGKDRGIYTHLEPIKKPFLRRAFGDDSGNLYEGQVADFNAGLAANFEAKTNKSRNDRSDIQAVVDALAVDDTEVWSSINTVIDGDEFLSFWAMEVLLGHWDGYSGNQNNFYLYHHPTDGLFHFIPWGTDGAFVSGHGEHSGTIPKSTYGASELTHRLWKIPEVRALYQDRLRKLMDELWDKGEIDAEVDRMGHLTGAPEAQLQLVKQFVDQRQSVLETELKGTIVDWPEAPRRSPNVCVDPPATHGTFELKWSDTHAYSAEGQFDFELAIAGRPVLLDSGSFSAAGPVQELDDPTFGMPRIAFSGTNSTTGRLVWVGLYVSDSLWAPGEIPFHGYEVFGIVIEPLPSGGYRRLGVIGDGAIILKEAGRTNGAAVKGEWKGTVATTL